MKLNRETAIKDTLHNLEVLMGNIGVEAVMNKMDGDTYWKLYTYFRSREGDRG